MKFFFFLVLEETFCSVHISDHHLRRRQLLDIGSKPFHCRDYRGNADPPNVFVILILAAILRLLLRRLRLLAMLC